MCYLKRVKPTVFGADEESDFHVGVSRLWPQAAVWFIQALHGSPGFGNHHISFQKEIAGSCQRERKKNTRLNKSVRTSVRWKQETCLSETCSTLFNTSFLLLSTRRKNPHQPCEKLIFASCPLEYHDLILTIVHPQYGGHNVLRVVLIHL